MASTETGSSAESSNEVLLLQLAKANPDGISNDQIKETLPGLSIEQVATLINKCLKNETLGLFQAKNKILYRYNKGCTKAKGSDSEEKIVYKIIEESGTKGIWIRDIRYKSNLNITQLNKVLKSLETKKLIKSIKSVKACKKKVYMLYNLEPDNSVTGGAWYQDQDFDSGFVDILNEQSYNFLHQKREEANKKGGGPLEVRRNSYATANDVHNFISGSGVSTVLLTVPEIESILYTLVLDNNAERIVATNGSFLYRAINRFTSTPELVKTPCGVCGISSKCADSGLVTPKVCPYLTTWLEKPIYS